MPYQRSTNEQRICAICGLQSRGSTVELHLTYGVSVWLCGHHASEAFQAKDGGEPFVRALRRTWQAANCFTRNRRLALDAHLRRYAERPKRDETELPGSYNWKALRHEAEERFANGESLQSVMEDLQERHRHDVADLPSARTIRRWFTEGRWRRGIRTRLRPGFAQRDVRQAARAQRRRDGSGAVPERPLVVAARGP